MDFTDSIKVQCSSASRLRVRDAGGVSFGGGATDDGLEMLQAQPVRDENLGHPVELHVPTRSRGAEPLPANGGLSSSRNELLGISPPTRVCEQSHRRSRARWAMDYRRSGAPGSPAPPGPARPSSKYLHALGVDERAHAAPRATSPRPEIDLAAGEPARSPRRSPRRLRQHRSLDQRGHERSTTGHP